jgi:hypothetical protein
VVSPVKLKPFFAVDTHADAVPFFEKIFLVIVHDIQYVYI